MLLLFQASAFVKFVIDQGKSHGQMSGKCGLWLERNNSFRTWIQEGHSGGYHFNQFFMLSKNTMIVCNLTVVAFPLKWRCCSLSSYASACLGWCFGHRTYKMSLKWMLGSEGITSKCCRLLITSFLVASNKHLLTLASTKGKLTYFTELQHKICEWVSWGTRTRNWKLLWAEFTPCVRGHPYSNKLW